MMFITPLLALINESYKLRRVFGAVMELMIMLKLTSFLEGCVKPIIKLRRNAKVDRGPPKRRRMVKLIKRISDEVWARMIGYGKR